MKIGEESGPGVGGRPTIGLHGSLDTLLPITTDSDVYSGPTRSAGETSSPHRYCSYRIGAGDRVDSGYDGFPRGLPPILSRRRTAFGLLEDWIEDGQRPPTSGFVPKPKRENVVDTCRIDVL